MNSRAIAYQLIIFVTQWGLMLLGFGLLTRIIAPLKIPGLGLSFDRYFDAGVKASTALGLSVVWLFIWDRQVRLYFYRHNK